MSESKAEGPNGRSRAKVNGTSENGSGVRLNGDWQARLLYKTDKGGRPTRNLRQITANAITVLANDPHWEGVLAYDEFAECIITTKPPPWRSVDAPVTVAAGPWTDGDTTRVQAWLAEWYALDIGLDATLQAVRIAADRNRVHPVRDWLDGLRWDGVKRAPSWLVEVMGAEDTPYNRAVGQAWLVSAVARIYSPGCKVDTVLVFEGRPGVGKSSVLRALVGDAWFLEMSITDVANKDAMQILRSKWIAEFPEIDGLSRTEQAHVKSYFTRQVDTYRESYGKGSKNYPRQIAFAATTNKEQYLTDETGGSGRRLWPVRCARGDVARATALRDQLWAEARARYESGEEWHLRDPELVEAEREEQDARFRSDPWEQPVAAWLAKPAEVGPAKSVRGVTTADVLAGLGIEVVRRGHGEATRVGSIMRRLGWLPGRQESRDGARVRPYRPVEGAATIGETVTATTEPAPPLLDGYDPELPGMSEDAFPDAGYDAL